MSGRLVAIFLFMLFALVGLAKAVDINDNDLPIDEVCAHWWDSDSWDAFDAGGWSPAKWGFESSSSSKYWSPDILYTQNYLFDNLASKCYFLPNKIRLNLL